MSSLQDEIERRGERIFELVDQNPESIFTKAGFYQRMMAFSMRDEHFKVQLFRFVEAVIMDGMFICLPEHIKAEK